MASSLCAENETSSMPPSMPSVGSSGGVSQQQFNALVNEDKKQAISFMIAGDLQTGDTAWAFPVPRSLRFPQGLAQSTTFADETFSGSFEILMGPASTMTSRGTLTFTNGVGAFEFANEVILQAGDVIVFKSEGNYSVDVVAVTLWSLKN